MSRANLTPRGDRPSPELAAFFRQQIDAMPMTHAVRKLGLSENTLHLLADRALVRADMLKKAEAVMARELETAR